MIFKKKKPEEKLKKNEATNASNNTYFKGDGEMNGI